MSSARVAPAIPSGRVPDTTDATRVRAAVKENALSPHATADQCLAAGVRIGEYHVVRVLHADEAGVAYLARDLLLQRDTVVLEHLPAALAHRNGSGQVVLRAAGDANAFLASQRSFIERAQRQARFDHPSTLPLWRCWYGNGTAYAAMPYHGGVTLADARRAMSHPPEESWLRAVILPLLDAIESLHALPALHLGISPDRVALRPDGRPVLLGPGPGAQLAVSGVAGPGAAYQPPELREPADHLPLGAWTDLYALAATLFHAITGDAPAPSEMPATPGPAIVPGPLAGALIALRSQWPRLNYSPGLVRAIDQGLAASPADRPQSVAQFRRALNPVQATSARPIAEDPAYLTAADSAPTPSGRAPLATMPSVPAQELPVLTDTSTHGPDKPPQWSGLNNDSIAADIERTLGMVAAHAARDAANLRAAALAGERRPLGERRPRRGPLRPLLLMILGGLLAAGAFLWHDAGEVGQSLRQTVEDLYAKVSAWRDTYDPFASVAPVVPQPRSALPDSGAVPQSAPIDTGAPAPSGTQLVAPTAPRVPSLAPPQAGVQADLPLEPPSAGSADANARTGTTTEPPSSTTAKAAALPESPRAACGNRTNFSLLYCMEQQCQRGEFADHPQCVRLRATGEVD